MYVCIAGLVDRYSGEFEVGSGKCMNYDGGVMQ